MTRYLKFISFLIFTLFFITSTNGDELKNKIYKNLRCLVCQGQTIADSNSEFAQTIKTVIDDQINNGMTEREIYDFMSEKYGTWILFNPPFKPSSYLLLLLPYFIFIFGGFIFLFFLKKKLKK